LYTRLAVASDKVYQLLALGRWFSPDTPASSTTKAGRHDIVEILIWPKRKRTKGQTTIYKALTQTFTMEQHEPHEKSG
jgi:hypothetical protein